MFESRSEVKKIVRVPTPPTLTQFKTEFNYTKYKIPGYETTLFYNKSKHCGHKNMKLYELAKKKIYIIVAFMNLQKTIYLQHYLNN